MGITGLKRWVNVQRGQTYLPGHSAPIFFSQHTNQKFLKGNKSLRKVLLVYRTHLQSWPVFSCDLNGNPIIKGIKTCWCHYPENYYQVQNLHMLEGAKTSSGSTTWYALTILDMETIAETTKRVSNQAAFFKNDYEEPLFIHLGWDDKTQRSWPNQRW